MDTKRKIIPLKELNLTNRFLFDEVLEDPDAHQDILSIIFGRNVPLLDKNETEKELRVSPLLRAIRMDVFSMDEEAVIYNTEMQQKKKGDLAKRSRYYQAIIDTSLLEPGVPDYNQLNSAYIIMIMTFDLFGYDKYMYTFKSRCEEVPECCLEDGAVRIFLNTRGKERHEVSEELVQFLYYLEHTNDETAANMDSERIKRIHQRVRKVKTSEEAGVRYMQAWEERYYEREEARNEGLEQGIKAIVKDYMEEGFDKDKIIKNCRNDLHCLGEKQKNIMRNFLRKIESAAAKTPVYGCQDKKNITRQKRRFPER